MDGRSIGSKENRAVGRGESGGRRRRRRIERVQKIV